MQDIRAMIAANKEENNILTQALIDTLNDQEEYIKDGDIYCKECDTPRTCFGFTKKVRCYCECMTRKAKEQKELEQREYDSLKAEKINALQSRIDGLEYFIDADVKEMQRDKEKKCES